jgi:hypothetical protein
MQVVPLKSAVLGAPPALPPPKLRPSPVPVTAAAMACATQQTAPVHALGDGLGQPVMWSQPHNGLIMACPLLGTAELVALQLPQQIPLCEGAALVHSRPTNPSLETQDWRFTSSSAHFAQPAMLMLKQHTQAQRAPPFPSHHHCVRSCHHPLAFLPCLAFCR